MRDSFSAAIFASFSAPQDSFSALDRRQRASASSKSFVVVRASSSSERRRRQSVGVVKERRRCQSVVVVRASSASFFTSAPRHAVPSRGCVTRKQKFRGQNCALLAGKSPIFRGKTGNASASATHRRRSIVLTRISSFLSTTWSQPNRGSGRLLAGKACAIPKREVARPKN